MQQKERYRDDYILVTGASSGLGAALATEFAKEGFDLVLVARRKDRLDLLAGDIRKGYGRKVVVMVCDLSRPDAAKGLFAETKKAGIRVSGLVNNAGYGLADRFQDGNLMDYDDMLQVMLSSCIHLSRLYADDMIGRGYGWILNISSLAAFMPASGSSPLYSPLKKFLLDFSQAHGEELKEKGIHVTALCPGFTRTEFHQQADIEKEAALVPSFMWMKSAVVARQGVRAVMRGDSFYINGRINRVLAFLGKHLPDATGRWIMRRLDQA